MKRTCCEHRFGRFYPDSFRSGVEDGQGTPLRWGGPALGSVSVAGVPQSAGDAFAAGGAAGMLPLGQAGTAKPT